MHRRTFSSVLLLSPLIVYAQASATSRIAILTDLVNAIGAAGQAISKLTAGFKDLVVAGRDTYDYVSAKRERNRLIDISRRTTNLISTQNILVVGSLDEYLGMHEPNDMDWARVIQNVGTTLSSVRELLRDVQHEDGSFVLESAFGTLNETLSSRSALLSQLAAMPAPKSKDEIMLLQKASAKYKVLIANAKQAIGELNSYVKSKE